MLRPNDIARHLRALGCSREQIRRHLARLAAPPAAVQMRPRAYTWLSWEGRIRKADNARRAAASKPATAAAHIL
jgi:hypothetical protein